MTYDLARKVFRELVLVTGFERACFNIGIPQAIGNEVLNGSDIGPLNERKILACAANSQKKNPSSASRQYKGNRNSFDRPSKQRETMHRL